MKRTVLIALVLALALAASAPVASGEGTRVCHVPGDHSTIQAAVQDATCGRIIVGPGTWFGATVTRPVEITGEQGAVINDGPNSHSFLRAGFLFPGGNTGSGATIRGLIFQGTLQTGYVDDGKLDFPIFSRGANDVTVKDNVFNNSLQAITNWHGSRWTISHNQINGLWVLCGGGIGILVGSVTGTPASDNLVSFNQITAGVNPDCGLYTTPGVALMSDARWNRPGGPVMNNGILHNQVSVTGYYGTMLTGVGIELTDVGRELGTTDDYVTGNRVGFNDVRGSTLGLAVNPSDARADNHIGRNLGDLVENRGDSENHPAIFW